MVKYTRRGVIVVLVLQKGERRFKQIGKAIRRFWFATGAFLMAMCVGMVGVAWQEEFDDLILTLILGGLLGICIQLIYERFFLKKEVVYTLLYGAGIVSLFGYYLYLHLQGTQSYSVVIRTSVLCFFLILVSIYIPTFKEDISAFSQSLLLFVKNFFTSLLSTLVLMLGLYAVVGAIDFLLFPIGNEVYEQLAVITWLGFFPLYYLSMIPIFPKSDQEVTPDYRERIQVPKFFEILLAYIIVPLLSIFTVILLVYVLQNIAGSFWQDGLLEPLLVSYVIIGWLTLYLVEALDVRIIYLFKKAFPFLLFIVTLLQGISSLIKTTHLGLTDGRYFILLLILFSIISTLTSFFFSKWRKWSPVLLLLLTFISMIPGIDAVSVANRSQKKHLTETLIKNEMLLDDTVQPNGGISTTDKEKIVTSVQYLRKSGYLGKISYLPRSLTHYQDFEETFGFSEYGYDQQEEAYQSPKSFNLQVASDETLPIVIDSADLYLPLEITDKKFYPDQSNIIAFNYKDDNYFLTWQETIGQTANLTLSDADKKSIMSYDMIFLRSLKQLSRDGNFYELLPEELTFVTENDQVKLTVFITSLYIEEEQAINGQFQLFVDFK